MTETGIEIRTVQVVRYVTPLREGGSLPAIAEADDGFLYVIKFRGAGQGTKALIADLIGAEIARLAGLKVPELVFAELDEAFGRTEPDEEIQDLLRASEGLNLGVHFLSGAISYDPAVNKIDPVLASKIVWLDAFLMNVDRTPKNTNMLMWQKELWLIDHGAALFFHHTWHNWEEQSVKPFVQIKDHVLLPQATALEKIDVVMKQLITPEKIQMITAAIPDSWFTNDNGTETAEEKREVYNKFLISRHNASGIFLNEAIHARETFI
jgi:hypothetical protein